MAFSSGMYGSGLLGPGCAAFTPTIQTKAIVASTSAAMHAIGPRVRRERPAGLEGAAGDRDQQQGRDHDPRGGRPGGVRQAGVDGEPAQLDAAEDAR